MSFSRYSLVPPGVLIYGLSIPFLSQSLSVLADTPKISLALVEIIILSGSLFLFIIFLYHIP